MNTKQDTTGTLESIRLSAASKTGLWAPVVGREIRALLKRKGLTEKDSLRVEAETCRILSKCVPPGARRVQRTGLVVGYVQSGKTLSFTALTALARDNKYQLVVVLGGTTTNLVEQSYSRLASDLDINGQGQRVWLMSANPSAHADTSEEINRALRSWELYPDRPERCPTVLIVAMKNHTHLRKLETLLKGCDLEKVSTLVVDDEGDQAGLNNKIRQRAESTTYSCIRMLRKVLPTHTYLLYTATPQAPLLISRIDMLSPQFADPIEPGEDYVGGKDLFNVGSPYIEAIPSTDLPDDDAVGGPPESLEKALRLFFVGVAAGCVVGPPAGNRSMMIHPSQRRDWHEQFVAWVRSTRTSWLNLLRDTRNSPDRRVLIQEFQSAYDDLCKTEAGLPTFDDLEKDLAYAIDQTQIKEVNARVGRIPTIRWQQHYSYILVGGTGLDRGFTVEGLTVTYMPRGAGMGNADTVQQRGRFFGYKRPYIGFMRIFLEQSVEDSFRDYVEHEQSIRHSLIKYRDSGKPLSEWRRAFFLDSSMSATRGSVLSLDYMRKRSREWIYPRQPHIGEGLLPRNKSVVEIFISAHKRRFLEDAGDPRRTDEQRHLVARGLSLEVVYRDLLVPLQVLGDDLIDHLHVLLQIERELEERRGKNETAYCDVYQMSKGVGRERSLDENGSIVNLMQGKNEPTGYPGDRAIRDDERVSIQIHKVNLRAKKAETKAPKGRVVAEAVPVVAVAIPPEMRGDALIEPNSA
jgi:hypothetical protein